MLNLTICQPDEKQLISKVMDLHNYLESCHFKEFWVNKVVQLHSYSHNMFYQLKTRNHLSYINHLLINEKSHEQRCIAKEHIPLNAYCLNQAGLLTCIECNMHVILEFQTFSMHVTCT